jgi:hypothetical protein
MTSFWQDVRYSLRMIVKTPGFAIIAILTLALGIGANTTIFSWINSTLLNPIPGLANPQEVVALSLSRPSESPFLFTYPDVVAMRDGQRSFAGITANGTVPMSLTSRNASGAQWRPPTISRFWAYGPPWDAASCPPRTRSRVALPSR